MYSAHYHLLLNHWPIIGTFIALGFFFISLVSRQLQLKQASLALFTFIALLSIPTYMSGSSAQQFFKDTPEVSKALVDTHQGAAFLALVFMEITGAFAAFGLWQFSKARNPQVTPQAGWNSAAVVLFSLATCGLMAVAGNTGGGIRHPEIAPDSMSSAIGTYGARIVPAIQHYVIQSSMWVWPVLETLHFFGLILIVGAIGVLNLRILGFLKQLPLAPLHRFIPWGIVGFVINIITGILFFIGMPPFYGNNVDFQLKMIAIVFAGANLMVFYCSSAFRSLERLGPGDDAPISAKLVAASSLFLWFAVLVMGRYMPFFEVLQ